MVYVFLADGFEEMEALAPVDILRRAGIEIATVGVTGKTVTGAHGIVVESELTEVDASSLPELIILPGGMGYRHLQDSLLVGRMISLCVEKKIPIAAICAAPSILGELGLLNGLRACCFPGFEDKLKGATLVNDPVCVDGGFITAKSAGHAAEFALKIVELLRGCEKAAAVREEIFQENS